MIIIDKQTNIKHKFKENKCRIFVGNKIDPFIKLQNVETVVIDGLDCIENYKSDNGWICCYCNNNVEFVDD